MLSLLNGWLTAYDPFAYLDSYASPTTPMKTDLSEEETLYKLEADLPGFKKEDIQIDLEDNILTISANVQEEAEKEKGTYLYKERSSRSYKRSFDVSNINKEAISATFENGVLTVSLPKLPEPEKLTKSISIS